MISNRIHLERAISRGKQSAQDELDAHSGQQQSSYAELDLPRPNPTMSQTSEMGDESEHENTNQEEKDASEAMESVEKLEEALHTSRKDLRKDLSRNAISVLETYSPEWFEFLHGADSPNIHTPADSDVEDDPKKRHKLRRAFTTGSGLREWRRRGSMHADGTLSSLAAEDLSADSDGNGHEHNRSVFAQESNENNDKHQNSSDKGIHASRQTLNHRKSGDDQHTHKTPTDNSEPKSSAKPKKKSKRKPRSKAQQGSKGS